MSIIKPVVIALLGVCLAATSGFAREAKSSSKPKSSSSSTSAKKKKTTASSAKTSRPSTKTTTKARPAGLASSVHFAFPEELPPEDLPEVEVHDEEQH
jgi:hypothetical protein